MGGWGSPEVTAILEWAQAQGLLGWGPAPSPKLPPHAPLCASPWSSSMAHVPCSFLCSLCLYPLPPSDLSSHLFCLCSPPLTSTIQASSSTRVSLHPAFHQTIECV